MNKLYPHHRIELKMKNLLTFVSALTLVGCQPLHISKANYNGRAISRGPVNSAQLSRGGATAPPSVGATLNTGDLLHSGQGTYVEISDAAQTQVILYPNTSVRVSSIWLEIGKLFVKARGSLEIKDQRVAGGVDGTAFFVESSGRSGITRFTVIEGQVTLRSQAGNWRPVAVRAPAYCTVTPGRQPVSNSLSEISRNNLINEANRLEQLLHGPGSKVLAPSVIGMSRDQAVRVLNQSNLRLDSVSTRPSERTPSGSIFGQRPAPGMFVARNSGVSVEIAGTDTIIEPEPSPPVRVPRVTGMRTRDAMSALRREGLEVNVRQTDRPSRAIPGTIVSQNPRSGTAVRRGSTITIVEQVGEQGPALPDTTLVVPDVIGMRTHEAIARLESNGLRASVRKSSRPSRARIGTIVSQNPRARTSVRQGSMVIITEQDRVSPEQQPFVRVPNVVGQSVQNAQATLSRAGLNGRISGRGSRVVNQSPSVEASVRRGSTVTLTVRLEAPPSIRVPNVIGQTSSSASRILQTRGLRIGKTSNDYTGRGRRGTIVDQTPSAGRHARRDRTVDVVIADSID